MSFAIPTQILAYLLGLIAVVIVIGGIALIVTQAQKYIERKMLNDAVNRKDK